MKCRCRISIAATAGWRGRRIRSRTLRLRLLPDPEGVFDCHGCGLCCRADWRIPVEDHLIEAGLDEGAVCHDGGYRLRRTQGQCAWLQSDGRCSVHARWGMQAKPLACQIFPFVLTPTPDGTVVGLSYFCPSVQKRQGRPLSQHLPELERLAGMAQLPQRLEPPFRVWGDTSTGWSGYKLYEEELLERLSRPDWESQLRSAAVGLARSYENWGRLPLEGFFPSCQAVQPEFPEEMADSLARSWVVPGASESGARPSNPSPSPLAAAPMGAYLRSLVRSKVLLKQPSILEGLALLCTLPLALRRYEDGSQALQDLEMMLSHSSQWPDCSSLARALLSP